MFLANEQSSDLWEEPEYESDSDNQWGNVVTATKVVIFIPAVVIEAHAHLFVLPLEDLGQTHGEENLRLPRVQGLFPLQVEANSPFVLLY